MSELNRVLEDYNMVCYTYTTLGSAYYAVDYLSNIIAGVGTRYTALLLDGIRAHGRTTHNLYVAQRNSEALNEALSNMYLDVQAGIEVVIIPEASAIASIDPGLIRQFLKEVQPMCKLVILGCDSSSSAILLSEFADTEALHLHVDKSFNFKGRVKLFGLFDTDMTIPYAPTWLESSIYEIDKVGNEVVSNSVKPRMLGTLKESTNYLKYLALNTSRTEMATSLTDLARLLELLDDFLKEGKSNIDINIVNSIICNISSVGEYFEEIYRTKDLNIVSAISRTLDTIYIHTATLLEEITGVAFGDVFISVFCGAFHDQAIMYALKVKGLRKRGELNKKLNKTTQKKISFNVGNLFTRLARG